MEDKLSKRFERITKQCVELSKTKGKIQFIKLYMYIEIIRESVYLLPILSKYYVHVFRTADKEFQRVILENDIDVTCASIAKDIIIRRLKDDTDGEFSF